jgi:HEAT repeat protein
MAITIQEVITRLGQDEPDYKNLAQMGPEAVPHLAALISGTDVGLASKAAYLASLIKTDEAIDALTAASNSSNEVVRVAAAAGLRNLTVPQATRLADRLLDDTDAGVRKLAVRAASRLELVTLEPKLRAIAVSDQVGSLRRIADDAVQKLSSRRSESIQ